MMSEILNIKSFWPIFVLSFLFLNPILAIPGIPHQFYGTITFKNGEKVGPGYILEAYVDGEVAGTAYTLDGKYGYRPFLFFVTYPENKKEGMTITFKLYDPLTGHTYPIIQSWKFEHGGYTKLDLTVEENYVSPRQEIEKSGGGGGGSGIFYQLTKNETEENITVPENESELDEILDLIASNKTEEAREALLKIEDKLTKELEDISSSKALAENLAITFEDLESLGLSFEDFQKALKDLETAKELMKLAEDTEDLETKLRLMSTVELLKDQIKRAMPKITEVKNASVLITPTERNIKDALSIAKTEKAISAISPFYNKTKAQVEKEVEVYEIKNEQTEKKIYKSKVTIKARSANVEIIEIIPKDIVENASELVFSGIKPEILERDPILKWELESVEKIEYIIPGKIEEIDSIITLAGIRNFCGDGICQENENCSTCEVDCGPCPSKQTLPAGRAILPTPILLSGIVGGVLATLSGILFYRRFKKKKK